MYRFFPHLCGRFVPPKPNAGQPKAPGRSSYLVVAVLLPIELHHPDVALARANGEENILGIHGDDGAIKLAERIGEGVVVTIFPDGGDRYLSTGLYRR